MRKEIIVTCPVCGRQYYPGELYLPKYFLGQPTNVVRDCYGKVLDHDGITQDVDTSYQCDQCDTHFIVHCDMKFRTDIDQRFDFKNSYKTKISTGLNLKED